MRDPEAFERQLEDAFGRYTAAVPVAVDARAMAETAIRARPATARPGHGRLLLPAVAVLMLVGGGVAMLAGGSRPSVPPQPSAAPSTAAPINEETPQPTLGDPRSFERIGARPATTSVQDKRPVGNPSVPIAVTLADGRVLVAGGADGIDHLLDGLIIDPESGATTAVPELINGRGAGVLLNDGRVLLIAHDQNATGSAAVLLNPRTGSIKRLPGWGQARVFRVEPSMALLHDGRVLITGGLSDGYSTTRLKTAVLFDPATDSFGPTGSMVTDRAYHVMVTLPDGTVLVAGGVGPSDAADGSPLSIGTAERYNPATGVFTDAGNVPGVSGDAMGLLLPDGRALVMQRWTERRDLNLEMGGRSGSLSPTGALFDPTTSTFTRTPGRLPSMADAIALLADGRLLVTGATPPDARQTAFESWAAIFDPVSGDEVSLGRTGFRLPAMASVASGRVIVAWGFSSAGFWNNTGLETNRVDVFR